MRIHDDISQNDLIDDATMNYKDTMATAAMSLMLLGLASFQEISAINVKGNSPRGSSMALSAPPPILLQRSLADDSIEKSQLSALQDLYNATNAISSSNFQDWFRPFTDPLHTHYCNFTGVSCDDDLYVTSLDLNQTGLLGTIPDSIRTLVRLRRFKVWMNDHVGVIPNAFGDLKELESLILGQNSFVGTIPEGLSQVTSLRRLLLQSNDLSGTVPNWLCNLSNLRELDFSRNVGLTGTLPACLGDLPNLREVRVRNSGFSGEIPPVLCARSEFACDGVACGAGTYQFPDGRQTSETTSCLACPTSSSLVIGQMNCDRDLGNTYEPSSSPSLSPSTEPSFRPTVFPSSSSSSNPSVAPSKPPSTAPSTPPSVAPSTIPSLSPSFLPTADLALFPSSVPSTGPTSSMLSTTNSPSSVPSQVMTDYNPATNNTPPSAAPSQEMMTRSPSHIPSVVPTLVPFDFPSFLPSESPSEPVLSPSTDFVIGGLNQGTTDDDAPKNWTWPVIAVILLLALCLLVGLFILARRRRRNRSEHSESLDCFPDDDSASIASSPPPEPVDPFCFPEIKEQVCFGHFKFVLCAIFFVNQGSSSLFLFSALVTRP